MNDFHFDLVGFDLDGTLLDTGADLAAATNHALASAGRSPIAAETIRRMIGDGARMMLRRGFQASGDQEYQFEPAYRALLDYYDANIAIHTRPFPGAVEAIGALADMGVKIAVVTNKLERLAVKLLGELGLADRFCCIIGGDTMGKGFAKPHRAPIDEMLRRCDRSGAAFVGDSIHDMLAARSAGIPFIAVSFGFGAGSLAELEPNAVIDSYDELIPALRRLGKLSELPRQLANVAIAL